MAANVKLVFGLALLAVLAFVSPVLAVAALAGFTSGLLVRASTRLLKRSRRARIASLMFPVAVLVGLAIWTLLLPEPRSYLIEAPVFVRVPYAGIATLTVDAGEWVVQDEVSLSESEFNLAVDSSRLLLHVAEPDTLFERFVNHLAHEGWQTGGFVDNRLRLIRTRRAAAPSRWFPSRTVGPISLHFLTNLRNDNIWVLLVPGENAELDLRVPKYTLASTYPPANQRVDLLDDDRESITVPVELGLLDDFEVRVAILSPLLRWRFGPALAELSAWSGFKWIVLLICAGFSEEIKKRLLAPPVKQLLGFVGVKGPPDEAKPGH